MSTSHTQTTTTSASTAGPLGHRQHPPTPVRPAPFEDNDLDEDEEEVIRKAEEKVRRMKERKAAAAAAAKQKAEEEAARKAVEEEWAQAAAREERRKRMAEAATARSRRGTSPEETSGSPRRPVVEIQREKGKGKGKAKIQPVDEDPDDGRDGGDDDDDPANAAGTRRSLARCRLVRGVRLYANPATMRRLSARTPGGLHVMPWLQPDQYQYSPDAVTHPTHLLDLPGPPRNPFKGCHLIVPATTRSFPSSVAVLVAPFKLQPAPSTLQHKPPHTKTYPKTYFDPGLTLYQALPSPNGLVATKCLTDRRIGEDEDGEGDEEVEEEEGKEPAPKKARSEKGKEREE
ncbi:hypothetical protein GG344DRAFT_83057 [Lentinula edodes]|nr:hypothetical protein GG344DRAFT_83057 [Lentinula edodes]